MSIATDFGASGRLSLVQAAWVIARRDFLAILLSKTFIFFLLGPLFPIAVGAMSASIGSHAASQADVGRLGVAMSAPDMQKMRAAADILRTDLDRRIPPLAHIAPGDVPGNYAAMLQAKDTDYDVIVAGTPERPQLIGTETQIEDYKGAVRLIAERALTPTIGTRPELTTAVIKTSSADAKRDQTRTAQGAQTLLFLLTMLLGGMVLSNLVEEKGNKIIEILAASIPMDAVFMGKLFAMLAVSLVALCVWGGVVFVALSVAGVSIVDMVHAPAVGWPLFVALEVLYFAMSYLVLGSLFLSVGAMAATVREVQTLSMPVTMSQLLVFFFASYTVTSLGSPMEIAACIVPFSSPFAMIGRAAQQSGVGVHLLALAWQALWVVVFIKLGAQLFRRRVMQSGPRTATSGGWLARFRR